MGRSKPRKCCGDWLDFVWRTHRSFGWPKRRTVPDSGRVRGGCANCPHRKAMVDKPKRKG